MIIMSPKTDAELFFFDHEKKTDAELNQKVFVT